MDVTRYMLFNGCFISLPRELFSINFISESVLYGLTLPPAFLSCVYIYIRQNVVSS